MHLYCRRGKQERRFRVITGDHRQRGTLDKKEKYNEQDERVLISAWKNKEQTIVILTREREHRENIERTYVQNEREENSTRIFLLAFFTFLLFFYPFGSGKRLRGRPFGKTSNGTE